MRTFQLLFMTMIAIALASGCASSKRTKYCAVGGTGLAKIEHGEMKVYYNNGSWKEMPALSFMLPEGSSVVFGFGVSGLGVVVHDQVRIYSSDPSSGKWKELSGAAFSLPRGYDDVFSLGENSLCVVVGGKVRFYGIGLSSEQWEEHRQLSFTLPSGWKKVFSLGPTGLGVLIDDTVRVYGSDITGSADAWKEYKDLKFTLSKGYDAVIGYDGGIALIKDGNVSICINDLTSWKQIDMGAIGR